MAAKTRDRDSAGRLLRVIGDCELFHMEAAIDNLKLVKTGIRSESLLKPSGDDVGVLERTAEGRVLSLSDHKRIAKLQAALTTVANAYGVQDGVQTAEEVDFSQNLIYTVAGAAMTQSMRDCTASRTNCCIWGPQSEKLHVLLDWMMSLESEVVVFTRDYLQQLMLEWIQPRAEKQKQLTACLTLFELLQQRCRKLKTFTSKKEGLCLLGARVGEYLDALHAVVERGVIRAADSHRVKPSKLALIALETLAFLCVDVAAQYLVSNEAAKKSLVNDGLIEKTVESMRFVLVALRQWHLHSIRRQFLGYALQHLQSYVGASNNLLRCATGAGVDSTRDSGVIIQTLLEVLCWHWVTTAPIVCTRSDASSRIQKNGPSEILAQVMKKWTISTFDTKTKDGWNRIIINPEMIYAQLRFVCILMDSIGGVKGCSKVFGRFPAEVKASFVFFFVQGLCAATKNEDAATVLLILKVLRTVLLPSDALNILNSQDEAQELLSQLFRLHDNTPAVCDVSDNGLQARTELELFVADFIISRSLFITRLVKRIQNSHTQSVLSAVSLVRTFLYQLDIAPQTPLHRYWRKQLTHDVLDLITHENYRVRRLAISCVPSLDAVLCIAGLSSVGIHDTKNHVVTSTLGYLFATSTWYSLESKTSLFIDACRFGNVRVHLVSTKPPVTPREWNDYATHLGGNVEGDVDKREKLQEELLSLCFGPTGWSKRIQSANARSEVLHVLLHKIFGAPRDPMLLRMLREFVGCGWVDQKVFGAMVKLISVQMMNVPRLSEKFLDDNSASATKTVEGLLFSRLAPLLVLRMLPRYIFGSNRSKLLPCGRENLNHLNEYIDHELPVAFDSEAISEIEVDTTSENLFHILARSVVDPLEFKEVKMLATECLAKFPPTLVLPFVLAYLVAFLRETAPQEKRDSSLIVDEESVPYSCGLVTAKLMVYYLNRVFAEDEYFYKDCDGTSSALVLLVQILGIPSVQDSDESLLTDLQRGCIDCIALLLSRLAANDSGHDVVKGQTASIAPLMDLLMSWIFGNHKNGECSIENCNADDINSRVQKLFKSMWSEVWYDQLPLQVRICCCNVLLSAISRSENSILASWKTQGYISRIALATESCSEEDVVAGGLQIIFSFLYKASESLSVEGRDDLQIVRTCFRTTAARLESTRSESVAMNGLKVLGVLVGKLPAFVGALTSDELQRFIDRCLIKIRDRQISPVVSELAQSLLQAMTPP